MSYFGIYCLTSEVKYSSRDNAFPQKLTKLEVGLQKHFSILILEKLPQTIMNSPDHRRELKYMLEAKIDVLSAGGSKKLKKESSRTLFVTVRLAPPFFRFWTFLTSFTVTFLPGCQLITQLFHTVKFHDNYPLVRTISGPSYPKGSSLGMS